MGKRFELDATEWVCSHCLKYEIDLIREYRTRLIADVVTGKVDVRRLAPETAETDPEDFESREIDEGIDDEAFENDEAEFSCEVTDADD